MQGEGECACWEVQLALRRDMTLSVEDTSDVEYPSG
jgi:hypothetical protein